MNNFKKGIACVLATLLLIMSMPIISFAAAVAVDGQTIALNETLVVEITEPNQVVRLYFTPEISGVYQFRSFDLNAGDPVGYIADATEYGIFAEGDDEEGSNFKISCYLGAGETYTLGAKMWGENTGSYSVCITEQAEFEYALYDGETATITNYNGQGGEISIPSKLDGYSVTAIGYGAFYGCDTLKAVEIPDTVTEVVYNAFAWCDQLAEVYLPTSVTHIGEQAFYACNKLKTVFYSGSESDREENLYISYNNECLKSAKWVYNSCAMGEHEFDGEDDITCNNCAYKLPVYHSITLDETQEVTIAEPGEEALFRFTPAESGFYSFSSLINTADTYGYIADANGRELASDDDSGDANNFCVSYYLDAGETYILGARCLSREETGTFTVVLTRMDIVSVDFHDTEIIAGVNAYPQSWYDHQTNSYVEWECYNQDSYCTSYTLTMSDGSTMEGFGEVYLGNTHIPAMYTTDQSYDNQWKLGGTYTVAVSLMDGLLQDTYTVTLVESPIVGFEMEPKVFMQYTNGGWYSDSLYDDNGYIGETPQYYSYDYHPYGISYKLEDGTTWSSDWYRFEWNGIAYYLDWDVEQSYENQWTAGNTYTVQASIAGFDFSYGIEIVGSPVVSVTTKPLQVYEHMNGYYHVDGYYDESDNFVATSPQYFVYNIPCPNDMVITLTDGTVIEGNSFEWNGQWYGVSYSVNQTYENRWLAGNTYEIQAEIAGYEFTYEIEVLKSPVASVTIPKLVLIEGVDGSYTADGYYNGPDDFVATTPEYFWYHYGARNFVVTMDDGTVYENEGFWWGDEWCTLSCSADQSYDNQWTAGNTYTATAEICGFITTYEIEVVENPVEAIIVESQQHAEYTNGRWTTDWISTGPDGWMSPEYFEYWVNPDSYTIVFKDGTTKQVYAGESVEIGGFSYFLDWGSDQSYESQWGVGVHTAWARLCGVTTEYTVEITQLAQNDQFEYMMSSDGVIITNTLTQEEVLEIPSEIDGVPVVGVAHVDYCSITEELIIPDSVRTIGDYVLWNLPVLNKVTFGSGVTNLTPDMFCQNFCLGEIVVSEDNPYFCMGEDGVLYDKDITTFIAYAVAANPHLEYVVPDTVINLDALNYDIYGYVTVVYGPNHSLYVTIDGVTYTRDMTKVVSCAKDKEGTYVMPDTVTDIAGSAFENCDGLTEVVISPSVTEIMYYTFASCNNLASVDLPEGLISIDQSAFAETTSLTSVDLPSTLTNIGEKAFYASGLTDLKVPDSVRTIGYAAFAYSNIVNVNLGEGVETIDSFAFSHTPITSVVLPDSLTYLGDSAFSGCSDLQTAEIGSGLEYISSETFYRSGLISITLPENVGYVSRWAFAYSDLTSVVFENPEVSLSTGAFRGCPLKSLQLGDQMKEIGKYTFAETDITEIDIPDSVTHIVYGAFADCEFLADIRIPTTVEYIGGHTFDNTAWYNEHEDGVTYLGHIAYNWKGEMAEGTAVAVQEGTTVIADYAFEDQVNMTEITLPSTLRVIGDYAFYGCTGLTSIHIPANVVEIGYQAFLRCTGVQSVTVDPANEYYTAVDGALYTADGDLVWDPAVKDAVSGVYLEGSPYKQVYQLGEEFDPTGMEVWVNFESGGGMYVTSGYIVKGFDSSVPGEQWVYVSYGGCDSWEGFWITVVDDGTVEPDPDEPVEPDVTLQYIEISSCPNKTVYEVGEEFDSTGLVLELYYSDGSREVVESGYTIEGFDSSVPGDCWPHVSYGGCTLYKAFRVVIEDNSIVEPTVTDILVSPDASNGLKVTVVYSDGTTEDITSGYIVMGFDPTATGEQEITVTYEGITKTFTVKVTDAPVVDENEPTFVVDDATARAGDTFTVAIRTENNPGIASLKLAIGYDSDILEFVSIEWKDFTGGLTGTSPTDSNPFLINWADTLSGNNTTDGTVALLTFKVKDGAAAGSTAITLSYDAEDVYDANYDNVTFATVDGTVNIIEYISGDVNGDTKINNKDLGLLLQYLNNWDVDVVELACDVNRDGKINNKDLGLLLQYLNNWNVELK